MHLGNYLGLLESSERQLTDAFEHVTKKHKDEPDIEQICEKFSAWSREHHGRVQGFVDKYSENQENEPENLRRDLFAEKRHGSLALLRDLHDLWLLTQEVQLCWMILCVRSLWACATRSLKPASRFATPAQSARPIGC